MASSTVYSKKVPGLPILEFKIMTDIKARLAAIDTLEVVVPLAVERCAERGVWDKRVITAALLEELKK